MWDSPQYFAAKRKIEMATLLFQCSNLQKKIDNNNKWKSNLDFRNKLDLKTIKFQGVLVNGHGVYSQGNLAGHFGWYFQWYFQCWDNVSFVNSIKSMSMRGPDSGDTCHLIDFNKTWPDWRAHLITSKAKVVWYLEFSGGSYTVDYPPAFLQKNPIITLKKSSLWTAHTALFFSFVDKWVNCDNILD